MKKLVIAVVSVVAINAAANLGLKAVKASGGTVAGVMWLAAPIFMPAPLTYRRMFARR